MSVQACAGAGCAFIMHLHVGPSLQLSLLPLHAAVVYGSGYLRCAGHLLLCDGSCMRAFHGGMAPVADDDKSLPQNASGDHDSGTPDPDAGMVWSSDMCNTLRCSRELFKHLDSSNEPFECPNCLAHTHQCFVCKKEGCSNASKGAQQQVFRCA